MSRQAEHADDSKEAKPTLEPIIEYFRLEEVNGYKTIQLTCEANAKIVSAENGSGKTTLLNALYGILAGKPAQLRKINFSRFALKLKGKPELLVEKGELSPLPSNMLEIIQHEHRNLIDIPSLGPSLVDALTNLSLGQKEEFFKSDWFTNFYHSNPYDKEEVLIICEDIVASNSSDGNRFQEIEKYVNDGLNGATILYLPTYRRIEAEMPEDFRNPNSHLKMRVNVGRPYNRRKSNSSWSSDQLIYFGLEDVETKLRQIADTIRRGTFEAYTRIGGRTLEQLLDGPILSASSTSEFNLEELKVVLARLGKADGEIEGRIANLIENDDINLPVHDYLRSFLGQLLEVYASDKDQEQAIEAFVSVINTYWKNDFDEKSFIFDKESVTTKVKNSFTGDNLPLNSLSSGEKQIVSVFARLYLSGDTHFIVLIDEPELSLSMDWQKKFLPDIFKSPSCEQLIAITHSPFVFDNELDPYAGPLKISNNKPS